MTCIVPRVPYNTTHCINVIFFLSAFETLKVWVSDAEGYKLIGLQEEGTNERPAINI